MNVKPEQIPDEVVEAACAALAVAMEFGDTWPGDYAEEQQNELRQAIRQTLSAALPMLLGEPVLWRARCADGKFMHFDYEPNHMREHHPLYTLPTQDTPNADQ